MKYSKNIFFDSNFNFFKNSILNYSAHFPISIIRSWQLNFNFVFCLIISESFKNINLNRLKNVFVSNVYTNFFWIELKKMLASNFVNFSKHYYYRGMYSFNLLAEFFLDIYFCIFDNFISSNLEKFDSRKVLYLPSYFYKKNENLIKLSYPIKMGPVLKYSFNLKNFSLNKLYSLPKSLLKGYSHIFIFERRLKFVRHKYECFFALVGSKKFAFFVRRKSLAFLKSDLNLSIISFDLFDIKSKNIFFLGFNIRFTYPQNGVRFNSIKSNKKYLAKILFKLDVLKKRHAKLVYNRIYSEIFILVNRKILTGIINRGFNNKKNFWFYLFQLESLRSTQFNKLLLSQKNKFLPNRELVLNILFENNTKSSSYFFNIYFNKMQFAFLSLLKNLNPFFSNSITSADINFYFLFLSFKKNLFLLYNNFYLTLKKNGKFTFFPRKSFINLNKVSSFYNLSFSRLDFMFLRSLNYPTYFIEFNMNFSMLEAFLSLKYALNKLRFLGFIHPIKNRPSSNSKFLFFDDRLIVTVYGYFAYAFLNWFRCVGNLNDLKYIISLIRQSCFLTLCRKHNKYKSWAFDVYTLDLLTIENLCFQNYLFPTMRSLKQLRRKFFPYQSQVLFDEKIFL